MSKHLLKVLTFREKCTAKKGKNKLPITELEVCGLARGCRCFDYWWWVFWFAWFGGWNLFVFGWFVGLLWCFVALLFDAWLVKGGVYLTLIQSNTAML